MKYSRIDERKKYERNRQQEIYTKYGQNRLMYNDVIKIRNASTVIIIYSTVIYKICSTLLQSIKIMIRA